MDLDLTRALTFGSMAQAYDRWRPTYPDVAVDWLAPTAPGYVADVGAGTGQLTGALLVRGLSVAAIEPDLKMLAVLSRNFPEAEAHQATSTSLPFDDRTLDAVLVATAFHWLPFEETVAEVQRVLKPGGWLGLVYNVVLPVTEWERELVATDPDRKGEGGERPDLVWPFPGGTVETSWHPWDWQVTPEHYRNNLATNSAVMRLPEVERRARLDAAENILRRVCDERHRPTAPVHHEAFCLRWTCA